MAQTPVSTLHSQSATATASATQSIVTATSGQSAQASTKSDKGALLIPVSGLPTVTLHLVQLFKDNKSSWEISCQRPYGRHSSRKSTKQQRQGQKLKQAKHLINSPLDWMAAFATYSGCSHFKPQQAFDLAAYTSIVINPSPITAKALPGSVMIVCSVRPLL